MNAGPAPAGRRPGRSGPGHTRDVSMIVGEVEVFEIDALPQERGDGFVAHTGAPGLRSSTSRSGGEPEVLLEAGQIEPGDADRDREGGPV